MTEEKRLLTEVYVFDYQGDAYGKHVEIEFCAFERPESKFSSLEETEKSGGQRSFIWYGVFSDSVMR